MKTAGERMLAAAGLIGLAPLLFVIGVGIAVGSPGPILFCQQRVGLRGRTFTMIKFRTMRVGAEADLINLIDPSTSEAPHFTIRDDPRVTHIGSFLRRYYLDELPQLWNVLNGTMSFVGPRPALPIEVTRYDVLAQRRLATKPGMTGPWQVNGRNSLTWDETVRLDLEYIDNMSVRRDLDILRKTVTTVFAGQGLQ